MVDAVCIMLTKLTVVIVLLILLVHLYVEWENTAIKRTAK